MLTRIQGGVNRIQDRLGDDGAQGEQKFGTFAGVYTPTILTILGVIMYLRHGQVVGNAGFGGAIVIVLLAHIITITTGLSVSSVATNTRVGAGGATSDPPAQRTGELEPSATRVTSRPACEQRAGSRAPGTVRPRRAACRRRVLGTPAGRGS